LCEHFKYGDTFKGGNAIGHWFNELKKKSTHLIQHLSHEIEDEDAAESYLDESLPLVGLVVMYFNTLEKSLDSMLCQIITDRTDVPGLITIAKLSYGAKVDLFKRFCDDFHFSVGLVQGFNELIHSLNEVGRLRNLVVHADWQNTDDEGYTFVRIKTSSLGMEQEYVQFSAESLERIANQTLTIKNNLYDYWERRCATLCDPRG
jgi:hydrogenase maturation factor